VRSVACLGNLTEDQLLFVDRLPALDDVAFVAREGRSVGGRGALVALIVSALGGTSSLITATGLKGTNLVAFLAQHGVNVDGISIDESCEETFRVVACVGAAEENTISFFVPASVTFQPTETQSTIVAAADILYFSTHKLGFNLHFLERFSEGKLVLHNLSSYMKRAPDYVAAALQHADVIIANAAEAQAFGSVAELFARSSRVQSVLVTQGKNGVVVHERSRHPLHVPAVPARATAPIGAGDAFAAGVIFELSRGSSLNVAAEFGVRVAAASVAAASSHPDLGHLRELV
jgi:sugar/nucleoside kinase (ribokinase family)